MDSSLIKCYDKRIDKVCPKEGTPVSQIVDMDIEASDREKMTIAE
jgi:hypothetical protein